MFGPLIKLTSGRPSSGFRGGGQHFGVEHGMIGLADLPGTGSRKSSRVRDPAAKGRRSGGLGADKANLVIRRAGAARKIPRHRAKAESYGRRGLAHADAAVAAGLMDAGARMDQRYQMAVANQILRESAARSGSRRKKHAHDPAALDNFRRDGKIPVTGIRR